MHLDALLVHCFAAMSLPPSLSITAAADVQEPVPEPEWAASLQFLERALPGCVFFQRERDASSGRKQFAYLGDGLEPLTGITAQQALAQPALLQNRWLVDDLAAWEQAEEDSCKNLQPIDIEVRLHGRNGALRWIRVTATPRAQEGGRVVWDGLLRDMATQRHACPQAHPCQDQWTELLHHIPGGIARLDLDLRILYANETQAQWLGTSVEALEGQLLQSVISASLMRRMAPRFQRALRGQTVVFENYIERPGGELRYRQTTIAPEHAANGRVVAVVVFAYDVTEHKRVEQELSQQKLRLSSLVNAIPDMVFLKDVDGNYVSCNPVFERFVGRLEKDIIGLNDSQLAAEAEADRCHHHDQLAMKSWQPLVYEETLTFADDGYCGKFETIKTPIRDAQGRVTGVLGVCRDITERKRAEQQIERLAFYDVLTGLPNRRLLLDRLERAEAACQRTKQLGALLFIDLDNFKDLNDTLGHDMGDQLLAQVAARLVAAVRETDTVSRFGGDEFVIMVEGLAPELSAAATQAETLADKLLIELNASYLLGGQPHYSTPSIGIALFGSERHSVDELLKRADMAMYQAKAAGRNTQRFFDPDMQAALHARSSLEIDLRQGLGRGEVFAHYQPVVDVQGRVTGAEALARWQHPERGLISPGEVIPLAEQTGLILPLGQHILRTSCAQLVRWAAHPHTAQLSIAVNVSARQFRQPDFVAQVLKALDDSGANPLRLKLELTESLLLGDVEGTIERMAQLKKVGVGFALDDFGTGYSSLSYLKRLPLDQIKIDQSFVRDVLLDPNDAAIVRTILALAQSLDLAVVAEGVETTGQLGFLRLHGCEAFQGYLFGRPVPLDTFEREHLAER